MEPTPHACKQTNKQTNKHCLYFDLCSVHTVSGPHLHLHKQANTPNAHCAALWAAHDRDRAQVHQNWSAGKQVFWAALRSPAKSGNLLAGYMETHPINTKKLKGSGGWLGATKFWFCTQMTFSRIRFRNLGSQCRNCDYSWFNGRNLT